MLKRRHVPIKGRLTVDEATSAMSSADCLGGFCTDWEGRPYANYHSFGRIPRTTCGVHMGMRQALQRERAHRLERLGLAPRLSHLLGAPFGQISGVSRGGSARESL